MFIVIFATLIVQKRILNGFNFDFFLSLTSRAVFAL